MKKTMRKAFCLSAALLLAAAMTAPAMASPETDVLFDEDLRAGEHLIRRVEERNDNRHYGDYDYVDWTHVTRPVLNSLTVDEDALIGELVRVEVREGVRLTVAEGTTLTIHGELSVKGELVNRGTIIIGDRGAYSGNDEIDPYYKSVILNDNGGVVTNYGNIEILRGEFQNSGEATFQNDGAVDVTNRHDDLDGIVNSSIMRTTQQPGVIVNNGAISVRNDGGYGIRNSRYAVLENNGEIVVFGNGNVGGTVVGNRPTAAATPADGAEVVALEPIID